MFFFSFLSFFSPPLALDLPSATTLCASCCLHAAQRLFNFLFSLFLFCACVCYIICSLFPPLYKSHPLFWSTITNTQEVLGMSVGFLFSFLFLDERESYKTLGNLHKIIHDKNNFICLFCVLFVCVRVCVCVCVCVCVRIAL